MSGFFPGFFQPFTARRVCTPPPLVRGKDTFAGWRGGWGVNALEDARHSSVLYIYKYFVHPTPRISCTKFANLISRNATVKIRIKRKPSPLQFLSFTLKPSCCLCERYIFVTEDKDLKAPRQLWAFGGLLVTQSFFLGGWFCWFSSHIKRNTTGKSHVQGAGHFEDP